MRTGTLAAGALLAAGLLVAALPSEAGERRCSVGSNATIQNQAGEARVLFELEDLDELDGSLIRRARLRIPYTLGTTEDRTLELIAMPVTTEWNAGTVDWDTGWQTPGGDFDHELYSPGRADLRRTSGVITFDLTVSLKERLEQGADHHGFLVTVKAPDREGIEPDDLGLLQSLGTATVTVSAKPLLGGQPRGRPGG